MIKKVVNSKQTLNMPVFKYCNNFNDFTNLMDEAKHAVKEIFLTKRNTIKEEQILKILKMCLIIKYL